VHGLDGTEGLRDRVDHEGRRARHAATISRVTGALTAPVFRHRPAMHERLAASQKCDAGCGRREPRHPSSVHDYLLGIAARGFFATPLSLPA
jgi:hypothetical protein